LAAFSYALYAKEQIPRLAEAAFDHFLLGPVDPWTLVEEIVGVSD
jgi:hypothetical protein